MTTRDFAVLLAAATAMSACTTPDADIVSIGASLSLPDAENDRITVPLDLTDNFPVRVQVCATGVPASVTGALQAHVWMPGLAGGVSPGTTDAPAVTLDPVAGGDGGCPYAGIVTLNAAGPGPIAIAASVDGAEAPTKCVVVGPALAGVTDENCAMPATVPALLVLSGIEPLDMWDGTVPRYSICAETAATKGSVTLTSSDPSILTATQAPLTGALVLGPCTCPTIEGGPGVSHVNFDVAIAPPDTYPNQQGALLSVVATLGGESPVLTSTEDPYSWSANSMPISATTPVVNLSMSLVATGVALPAGEVFTATISATAPVGCISSDGGIATEGIEGLSVGLSTTTGVAFSPSAVTTDATGTAAAEITIPYGSAVEAVMAAGNVSQKQPLATPNPPTVTLTATWEPAGNALPGGEVMEIIAQAKLDRGGAIIGLPLGFATTTTGVSFAPASLSTDAEGMAISYVTVPYGTQVTALVTGGGAAFASTLPSAMIPTLVLSPIVFTPAQGSGLTPLPTGQLYEAATSATVVGVGPVAGLSLAFASTTTGVTFAPAAALTNDAGLAQSLVTVPYDTQVAAVVSGPAAIANGVSPVPSSPAIGLTVPVFGATSALTPQGQVFTVQTSATLDGGAASAAIVGLPVAFTVTYATQASPSPSPSPVLTNASGQATAYVLVPYDTELVVEVAGGGAVNVGMSPIPTVTLSPPRFADAGQFTPVAWLFAVQTSVSLGLATLPDAGGPVTALTDGGLWVTIGQEGTAYTSPLIEGVAVNFGPNLSASDGYFPVGPITTDAGIATSFIPVPLDGGTPIPVVTVVSALGSSASSSGPL